MTNSRKFVLITVLLFIFSNQSIFSQSTSYHARYSVNEGIFESKQQIKTLDNGTLMVGKWGPTIDDSAASINFLNRKQKQHAVRSPL
jgi:hypothetical protein